MAFPLPRASFTRQAWQLDPPEVAALMDKIRRAGVPLKEYAGVSPQYGIKTGYNDAFLIDTPTRDALVAADPKCAEIIKPYLRGRDIERWTPRWRNMWMIGMKSSSDHSWPWADAGPNPENMLASTYPALFAHFKKHERQLRARQDQGRHWWELRPCAYWEQFDGEKIIYRDIAWQLKFMLDREGYFVNNTVYFLPINDTWTLAVLNAPVGWWFSWRIAEHGKDEALRYFGDFVEAYPLPPPHDATAKEANDVVSRLSSIRQLVTQTCTILANWYRLVLEIKEPTHLLLNPLCLSAQDFVEEIKLSRGRRKPLSAAAVQAVREEYANTVQPMHAALQEAERLERRLSDLVNEAYGLTSEDVRLMWATAPPRMPLAAKAEEPGERPLSLYPLE